MAIQDFKQNDRNLLMVIILCIVIFKVIAQATRYRRQRLIKQYNFPLSSFFLLYYVYCNWDLVYTFNFLHQRDNVVFTHTSLIHFTFKYGF